jgi:hypothetical protein
MDGPLKCCLRLTTRMGLKVKGAGAGTGPDLHAGAQASLESRREALVRGHRGLLGRAAKSRINECVWMRMEVACLGQVHSYPEDSQPRWRPLTVFDRGVRQGPCHQRWKRIRKVKPSCPNPFLVAINTGLVILKDLHRLPPGWAHGNDEGIWPSRAAGRLQGGKDGSVPRLCPSVEAEEHFSGAEPFPR